MAGFAGDPNVGIVSLFFIMPAVALTTVRQFLFPVFKSSSLSMALGTGHPGMGLFLIINCSDQRHRCRRLALGMAVAVKTRTVEIFSRPGVLQVRLKMATHARLVFGSKRRQFGLIFVADTALFFKSNFRRIPTHSVLRRKLFMRVVTRDAELIAFRL